MKNIKTLIFAISASVLLYSGVFAQTLTSVDGSKVDLGAQKGKVVILAVGASWLPLSAKQADFTNQLAKKYAGRDVAVFFVATDSTAARSKNFASDADVKKFAATNKLSVPVLRDSDGAATLSKFGIDQIPSFVIIDRAGRQVGQPFGGIDPKYDIIAPISSAVDKLL
jgi:thiol-disulfide isomerase/thioredoxin